MEMFGVVQLLTNILIILTDLAIIVYGGKMFFKLRENDKKIKIFEEWLMKQEKKS